MLYLYTLKDREYVVKIIEEIKGIAKIEFIKRVNGGKGRLPKIKLVKKDNLNLLVNMEVAKKLANG